MRPSHLRRRAALAVTGVAVAVAAGSAALGGGVTALMTDTASTNGSAPVRDIGDGTTVTSPTLTGVNAPAAGMSGFAAARTGVNCDLHWSKVSGPVPDRVQVTNGQRSVAAASAQADGSATDAKPGLKAQTYTVTTRKGENWTSPANLARTATCETAVITPANAAWESVSGVWTQSGVRQVATTAGAENPLRVVDAGDPDADVRIKTSPTGGGDAVAVRVSDKDNYLRARTTHSETRYQATASTVSNPGYYYCADPSSALNGSWCMLARPYWHSLDYYTTWSYGPKTSSNWPTGRWDYFGYQSCGGDYQYDYKEYVYIDGGIGKTDAYSRQPPGTQAGISGGCIDRTYAQYSPPSSSTVYSCPQGGSLSGTTCTRQDYGVTLEKVVASKPSALWSWTSGTTEQQVSDLRVVASGAAVAVYLNGASSAAGQVMETFNQTATKHGVSYADSPVKGSLLSDFYMTAA